MNKQFKEQITYKAREFATAYTNQLFPNEPAFSFGHEGWAKFVDAMVELAGAHPDKGTSALAAPVVPAPVASAELDAGPWHVDMWPGGKLVLQSHQFKRDAALIIDGDFADAADKRMYADALCAWMNKHSPSNKAAPVAQLSEPPTDEQMDSIYRDVWTTVPHGKRLFEFGRRVIALAAAPTTPKDAR